MPETKIFSHYLFPRGSESSLWIHRLAGDIALLQGLGQQDGCSPILPIASKTQGSTLAMQSTGKGWCALMLTGVSDRTQVRRFENSRMVMRTLVRDGASLSFRFCRCLELETLLPLPSHPSTHTPFTLFIPAQQVFTEHLLRGKSFWTSFIFPSPQRHTFLDWKNVLWSCKGKIELIPAQGL